MSGAASDGAAGCNNHSHLMTNQISRERWQPIVITIGPAIFVLNVPIVDILGFF